MHFKPIAGCSRKCEKLTHTHFTSVLLVHVPSVTKHEKNQSNKSRVLQEFSAQCHGSWIHRSEPMLMNQKQWQYSDWTKLKKHTRVNKIQSHLWRWLGRAHPPVPGRVIGTAECHWLSTFPGLRGGRQVLQWENCFIRRTFRKVQIISFTNPFFLTPMGNVTSSSTAVREKP